MPNRGIWQHTRKMKRVMAVHNTFSLNWIFLSGFWISGSTAQNGFITSKNLMPMMSQVITYTVLLSGNQTSFSLTN